MRREIRYPIRENLSCRDDSPLRAPPTFGWSPCQNAGPEKGGSRRNEHSPCHCTAILPQLYVAWFALDTEAPRGTRRGSFKGNGSLCVKRLQSQ